jgi:hypothetical protein
MGFILKGIGAIIGLFIFLALLGAMFGSHNSSTLSSTDTKTAYTRDGVNFISKERVDENIKYEYAKPGDYQEVKVPLSTIVVGESVIPDSTSKQDKQTTPSQQTQPTAPKRTGQTQIFSTDFGKIQFDVPNALVLGQDSSGTGLFFEIPNAEFSWAIVAIRLNDPHDLILEDFADYQTGQNYKYDTMTTNDGHRMLFYTIPKEGKQDGKTIYRYMGFIDYIKDKNLVVSISADSETYYRKLVSAFSKEEFENTCKSFAFIN